MATKKTKGMDSLPRSKEARRKLEEASRHRVYLFPTLTMRQGAILVECIKLGMEKGISVDEQLVTDDEFIELAVTLLK